MLIIRIFEIFTYNLKNIKFKDTKDYFDNVLNVLNLNYSNIMFTFNGDVNGDICKKVTKTFSNLCEYVQYLETSTRYPGSAPEYCFSSIRNISEEPERYIKAEHIENFCSVLKKVPNPINFGFMGVVLDNVDWYKDESKTPILDSKFKYNFYDNKFRGYFSNSIRFYKEFDFGNKLNLIEIIIERKIFHEELEPYPDAFNKILSTLGTPIQIRRECIFSKDENNMWLNACEEFNKFKADNSKNLYCLSDCSAPQYDENYLVDSITPISGFSPKKIFSKFAKAKGYRYHSCKNGCYKYQYINANNHIFTVELMNIPFSSFFEATIAVKGYNFSHTLINVPQVAAKDPTSAEIWAREVFDVAGKVIEIYDQKLTHLYGKTPKWYRKSVDSPL